MGCGLYTQTHYNLQSTQASPMGLGAAVCAFVVRVHVYGVGCWWRVGGWHARGTTMWCWMLCVCCVCTLRNSNPRLYFQNYFILCAVQLPAPTTTFQFPPNGIQLNWIRTWRISSFCRWKWLRSRGAAVLCVQCTYPKPPTVHINFRNIIIIKQTSDEWAMGIVIHQSDFNKQFYWWASLRTVGLGLTSQSVRVAYDININQIKSRW